MKACIALLLSLITGLAQNATNQFSGRPSFAGQVLSATASGGGSTPDVTNGLVLEWKYNGDYTDATGNGHDAIPTNNPVFTVGQDSITSHAIQLLVASTQYCYATYSTTYPWSMTGWFKATNTTEAAFQTVMSLAATGSSSYYWDLYVDSSGVLETEKRVGGSTFTTNMGVCPVNQWTSFAIVASNSTSFLLYTNGIYAGNNTNDATDGYSSKTVLSGCWRIVFPARTFDGDLDDHRFYSRGLSAAEVLQIHQHGAN